MDVNRTGGGYNGEFFARRSRSFDKIALSGRSGRMNIVFRFRARNCAFNRPRGAFYVNFVGVFHAEFHVTRGSLQGEFFGFRVAFQRACRNVYFETSASFYVLRLHAARGRFDFRVAENFRTAHGYRTGTRFEKRFFRFQILRADAAGGYFRSQFLDFEQIPGVYRAGCPKTRAERLRRS